MAANGENLLSKRARSAYCDVHAVMGKLALCCLDNAEQDDVRADGHERNVQVRGVNILSGWLIPVTTADLHSNHFRPSLRHYRSSRSSRETSLDAKRKISTFLIISI